MKIYQKVFFSIINDLDFLTGFDLNNSKNSVELLNWLIYNYPNKTLISYYLVAL
jgi:hypothetical protein